MDQAIQMFTYIWQKILTTMFGTFTVAPFVSIGWIVLIVAVIGMVIKSILNLPIGVFTSGTVKTSSTSTGKDRWGREYKTSRTTTTTRTGRGRV